MVKKFFTNRVVLNTIVLFLYTFIVEMVVRVFTNAAFNDIAVVRIAISSFLLAFIWSYITHFFKKLVGRILNIIYILLLYNI